MKEELLKGLTEEQIEKLRNCKDAKEALELAREEGIELSEEQLDAVSGGACVEAVICPICKSDKVIVIDKSDHEECCCEKCKFTWIR